MKLNLVFKSILVISIVTLVAVGCGSTSSSGSKPSKQELTDHFVELSQDEGGLSTLVPKKTLEKVYGCLFDEAYDDLSPEALKAMLKVKVFDEAAEYPFDLNEDEKKIFDKASATCEEKFKDDPDLDFGTENQNNG